MSRKANCYDNGLVESFFSTLKTECFDQPLPATKQQTRLLLFDYIEGFTTAAAATARSVI